MAQTRFVHQVVARVQWHANGAFTRVDWRLPTDAEGFSRGWHEIPTEAIPADLRKIGSQFHLTLRSIFPEDFTTGEELWERLPEAMSIERIDNLSK